MSINSAHSIADLRSDAGDQEAADAIRQCAGLADERMRALVALAWACTEKNGRKRAAVLRRVLMEMDSHGESLAQLPMREYAHA